MGAESCQSLRIVTLVWGQGVDGQVCLSVPQPRPTLLSSGSLFPPVTGGAPFGSSAKTAHTVLNVVKPLVSFVIGLKSPGCVLSLKRKQDPAPFGFRQN